VNLIHPTPSPLLLPAAIDTEYTGPVDDDANVVEGSVEYQDLVDACNQHYQQLEIGEKDVIPWFIYAVHNNGLYLF
jgi:hypothetical protein